MPIYAYRCESCGFQQESLQKISDAPLTHCPECQQETLKKQLTAAGFQLKGAGWYATDFKNNTPQAKATNTPSSEAKTAETGTSPGSTTTSGTTDTTSDTKSSSAASCAGSCACH